MPVKLKFDAYPFQDYGIVEGKLTKISPTTKAIDTEQGMVESYELEVKLDQNYIQAKNKRVALRPGQTATAEVIVRQRRLIDFALEPFKKLQKDGLEL
jgi:HlyD family secretion protein